jgi:hypothetical protein
MPPTTTTTTTAPSPCDKIFLLYKCLWFAYTHSGDSEIEHKQPLKIVLFYAHCRTHSLTLWRAPRVSETMRTWPWQRNSTNLCSLPHTVPKFLARRSLFSENNEDLALAEKWLKEQAQAQGWAKAQKLQVKTIVSDPESSNPVPDSLILDPGPAF